MNKVVIEVTADGWTTEVHLDGKVYKERHVAKAFGSESVEGNFEQEDEFPEVLYDSLNITTQFEIMQALHQLEN